MRAQLDPERTLIDTISPGSEWVETAGGRRHVLTYLAEFLFPAQRANSPVKMLSGGERNRLLLARLFAQPANLLVLDEPTNDLDIESLELLEATLQAYPGTLLLVSHDRTFLDNVVTQTLVAEGPPGNWKEYVGGYSDWVAQRASAVAAESGAAEPPSRDEQRPRPATRSSKLTFKEQRELDVLPAELEALEHEQQALTARMSAPDYHRLGPAAIKADRVRAAEIEHQLAAKFERWGALDARANAAK
jgi:ATP-binding cassette subfamily F protein uup